MKPLRTAETVGRALEGFFRENRRMPTYSEMTELLGLRSKSAVHFWVRKLLARGVLTKDGRGFLHPAGRALSLPLAGEVPAGFPSPAEEELRDILSFDEYLVGRPEASFLLRVRGDSMTGEGIKAGDLVIVERGKEPRNGDVIVAEVDREWTMKYFRKRGAEVTLEAANPAYPPLKPRNELRIAGVVTAVIRKYHR